MYDYQNEDLTRWMKKEAEPVLFYTHSVLEDYHLSPYVRVAVDTKGVVFTQTLFGKQIRLNISFSLIQPILDEVRSGCSHEKAVDLMRQANIHNADALFNALLQGGMLE